MKPYTLHMIGNAHIDPVWLWPWQEGFHEILASFRSALDRMKEYPAFTFTASSASFFEWVEHHDPTLFAEIQQSVAEGRWGLVGGWWIEPDCNLPCGESFVRQALYGQGYFKEKFGKITRTGYNVDSFGHNGSLPQILKKCGIENYVFMRPGPHEKDLPGHLFWWESPDGSRVLSFRVIDTYATWEDMLEELIKNEATDLSEIYPELMCFYGVGDHGGGPTAKNIETILHYQSGPQWPRLVFSTPERFFEEIRAKALDWPMVKDDLQHHASGCYSAHSGIKRWNRQAENKLLASEKLSSIAAIVANMPYPEEFTRAWKNVLFNQFHDSLAGTCLEIAYQDAQSMYGESLSIASRAINDAAQALIWQINIPSEDNSIPIVVFNPNTSKARVYVEAEIRCPEGEKSLVDASGNLIPFQNVQPKVVVWGTERAGFLADLPALGYEVYRLKPTSIPAPIFRSHSSNRYLESSRYQLEFNQETGCLRSLYDKHMQIQFLSDEAAKPVVIDDPSDTWSHGVFRFDRVVGVFTPVNIKLVEDGPVQSTLCVESKYSNSYLWQYFTIYQDLDQIDVAVTVDWHEQYKMLKLRFPLAIQAEKATYEIPYGTIQRPMDGAEEPGQSWLDVSGTQGNKFCGLSLLNDGKYSYDVNNGDIGLTVLRSPIYAQHDPARPDPARQYEYIDQGIQRFHYSLVPHAGNWQSASIPQRAAQFNQQPILYITNSHPGILPLSKSFISCDQPNILINVVKKSEAGGDWIIRAYETHGLPIKVTIELIAWQRSIQVDFQPYEIKTLRIPANPSQPCTETSMIEMSDL